MVLVYIFAIFVVALGLLELFSIFSRKGNTLSASSINKGKITWINPAERK